MLANEGLSIRRHLLSLLIGMFIFSWLAVTAFTYIEAEKEIEELFDAQLAQMAGTLQSLASDSMNSADLNQKLLQRNVFGHQYERNISFQIWKKDHLVLRSRSAPVMPMANMDGFADKKINNENWRVFLFRDPKTSLEVYVGENYRIRNELITNITRNTIVPLLWALPLLAIIVWISIGRALAPVKKITRAITARSPRQLEPISIRICPKEVQPLVKSINMLLQRLHEAFTQERRFASDASHELRTPLAILKTNAQVALRAEEAEVRNHALQNIIVAVNRNSHLVEQLLTLSRLEPDAMSAAFRPLNVYVITETVMSGLASSAIEKNIEIDLDTNGIEPKDCSMNGYAPGLNIMLRNLIDNAIRYTPEGGTVSVKFSGDKDVIHINVEDSGVGIAPEDREQIFQRFFRKAGQQIEGCGLGLSIVQRIIELHNGSITLADSMLLGGLNVCVTFQRSRE